MQLYELIKQVSDILIPETNELYNYILYTSDDNGGFLRTRYCWWNKPFPDRKINNNYKTILITCKQEINSEYLSCKEDTKLKIQFHYDYSNATIEDAEWDIELGYRYVYLIDLEKKTFVKEYRKSYF